MLNYKYNTGGREKYYKALYVRDCATRATAIANNMDYKDAYKLMWKYLGGTPRNGVSQQATNRCLESLGWAYNKLEKELPINDIELPKEDLILRLKVKRSGTHIVAFVDGFICDTWNCTIRNPMVIGYWTKRERKKEIK